MRTERHLKICGDCFQSYMNMREAIFLQKGGEKIPTKMRDAFTENPRYETKSHFHYCPFSERQNYRLQRRPGFPELSGPQGKRMHFAIAEKIF
jgi:hypothetical protein